MMRRREFIAGLGAAAWPLAVSAQQPAMPVIGWLDNTPSTSNRIAAFWQGLNAAGFVEGRNVSIDFRRAESLQPPALAADLVHKGVAVIVTNGSSTLPAKAATSTIPIVFVTGGDPVVAGFVDSLARPGGNVTGLSFNSAPLNPRRLEILHELVPKPAVIALLMDANFDEQSSREVEAAARALGRQTLLVTAGNEGAIDDAFTTIVQTGAGALFVSTGPLYNSRRVQLVTLAGNHRLAASYHLREFVEAGGLMSYGASTEDAFRHTGLYVSRILKGEKPGDMPVELPTRYELVFNLTTAKALKLDIPAKLLALADEVIE
jgi:putative tryptophan/tyrosine transport system substrate-binding protein